MATTGPFHSLTDTNKHELTELLHGGRSIRSAAGQLGLNYTHALNFAHHINHDTSRKPCNQHDLARAVAAVAAGATLTAAAKAHQVPLTAVFHAATVAGAHKPRSLPRGAGTTERRINYLLLRISAMGQADAAKACGIHRRTARDFDRGVVKTASGRRRFIAQGPQSGTYNRLMKTLRQTAHIIDATSGMDLADIVAVDPARPIDARYLSLMERERIRDMLAAGHNYSQIGQALGRHRSTISREVRRNTCADGQYFPTTATRWAAARRLRPKDAKIASDQMLAKIIQDKLSLSWSPEQIAGWLRWQYPETARWHVCHETIYQALYIQARGGLKKKIEQALRRGTARRTPRTRSDQRRSRFVDEPLMIADRPAEVEDRAVPGHWEGDLILGAGNASAIGTLVERSTRYVMLVHLPSRHDAESVAAALAETIQGLPDHLIASLTWDQGSEMAAHRSVSIATGAPVYFCDPASPWQRGSNENTNGLLRQYFPKGTDLSVHSKEDLEFVAAQLNGRPRKTLGYRTPAMELAALLGCS